MTEIRPVWEEEAGPFLELLCDVFDLDYMRAQAIFFTEPMYDLDRKWALFEGGEIVSILTTVPLEFGWGRAAGVAGVATRRDCQGRGLAAQLLQEVIRASAAAGEGGVLLFAKDARLYERVGFKHLDQVIRGPILAEAEKTVPMGLDLREVRRIYAAWAAEDPNRLRRDDLRWKYWRWNLRVCSPVEDGYVCLEGGMIREAVLHHAPPAWALPPGTEWLGLESMAKRLGIELASTEHDLYLLGYNVPAQPQMYMTDQF